MERDPHRDLGHLEAGRGRRDRLAVKGDRGHDVALARLKRLEQPPRVAQRVRVFRFGRGEELLKILERLDSPAAAPPQRVDDLVPGYGLNPGRKRLPGVPGVSLEMDRQQGLLHRILDICVSYPRACERRPRHRPHRPSDVFQ